MKILILVFFISLLHANDTDLNYDPFKQAQKIIKKSSYIKAPVQKPIKINAIFNKKAFINGRFYSVGDKIRNYKIIKVTNDTIWIKNNNVIKSIKLKNNKTILKIKKVK
jgi:hypothetical protein